jgi:predicted GTPase
MNFRLLQIHINPKHNIKHNIKMTSLSSQDVIYINKCVDICDKRISNITSNISNITSKMGDSDCKLGVGILAFVKVEPPTNVS